MRSTFLTLLAISAFVGFAVAENPQEPPKGFVALFNGKDLDGWRGMPHFSPYEWKELSKEDRAAKRKEWNKDIKKHWSVQDGAIVNDGEGVYLTTKKSYGDFELMIDWNMAPLGDSGIYLRGVPQVQIWDTREEAGKWPIGANFGSGSLWNNKEKGKNALVLADRPLGEWNSFFIRMKGDVVTVKFNDNLVVDQVPLENYWKPGTPIPAKGPIQLQTHGGEIRWRNVYLRELGEND